MFLTRRLGGFLRQGPFHVKHLFISSSESNYPPISIYLVHYINTHIGLDMCLTPKQVLEWECHVEIMRTECHYLNGRARFSQMCEHWTRLLVMWMALHSWGWGPAEDHGFSPHRGRVEGDSGEKPLTSPRSPLIHLCLFHFYFPPVTMTKLHGEKLEWVRAQCSEMPSRHEAAILHGLIHVKNPRHHREWFYPLCFFLKMPTISLSCCCYFLLKCD